MHNTSLGLSIPLCLGDQGYFKTNKTSLDQIKTNIQNILLTRPGERRFNNGFGSGLYNLAFEHSIYDLDNTIIKNVIQEDLNTFLNGVVIKDVLFNQKDIISAYNNIHNNIFIIKIVFEYNKMTSHIELKIVL